MRHFGGAVNEDAELTGVIWTLFKEIITGIFWEYILLLLVFNRRPFPSNPLFILDPIYTALSSTYFFHSF